MAGKEQYLTIREAGEVLKLSEYYLRLLCREGRIDAIRIGGTGTWRVPASSIDRFLHNGGQHAAA